jgi:hypothetical protein
MGHPTELFTYSRARVGNGAQMREVTGEELDRLRALLDKHDISSLMLKHTPPGLEVGFDVQWLDLEALAASFTRRVTAGAYKITLSPKLLEWGLIDRTSFSTIILHELGHIVDRKNNWRSHPSLESLSDGETLEYEADDFVVRCGWGQELVDTLGVTAVRYRECGMGGGMSEKRLSRLSCLPEIVPLVRSSVTPPKAS